MASASAWIFVMVSRVRGNIRRGIDAGAWSLHDNRMDLETKARAIEPERPFVFYDCSEDDIESHFCGPSVITEAPSREIALANEPLFEPLGEYSRLGFRFRLQASSPRYRMPLSRINMLEMVIRAGGNASHAFPLSGQLACVPVEVPWRDAEKILRATGATAEAYETWERSNSRPRGRMRIPFLKGVS